MITDLFALLNEPRRPWIDPEHLKSKFHALSSEVHPDRFHQATDCEKELATKTYASLNAAYTTLKEPKDRLLHLLELERGSRPGDIQKIPPGTMDLFVEIGQACRDIDTFLKERSEVTSPLVKVQYFRKALGWVDELGRLQQMVNAKRDLLVSELPPMNATWEALDAGSSSPDRAAKLPLDKIEQIYRGLSYVSRWTEQIQQRLAELA
ncbi:MAG: hypothetical protein JNN07_23440 [Verrucomicrobiales bacterium]|nr:hypothetical protein [Verrucomicrobiales bacterium]